MRSKVQGHLPYVVNMSEANQGPVLFLCCLFLKGKIKQGRRERWFMAQQLRECVALAEELGLVLITHILTLTTVLGDPILLQASEGNQACT